MTFMPDEPKSPSLSEEEWLELCSLKEAIDCYPAAVAACKMERFTDLLVRTLKENEDTMQE